MQCGADLQDFVRGWGALHGALDHDTCGQDFLQQAGHYTRPCSMRQVRHTISSYHQPALAAHSFQQPCLCSWRRVKGGEGQGEFHSENQRRCSRPWWRLLIAMSQAEAKSYSCSYKAHQKKSKVCKQQFQQDLLHQVHSWGQVYKARSAR